MRAESTIKPTQRFSIEEHNGTATVRFFQNVQKEERFDEEGQVTEVYVYDEYLLQLPARKGLASLIDAHYDDWLAKAIDQANRPKPETEREALARLQMELDHLQAENAFLLLELAKGEV